MYIVPRNTVFTETFRSEVLQYEVYLGHLLSLMSRRKPNSRKSKTYLCAVLATFSQERGKSASKRLFAVSSVGNHTSSWVVSGVVISAVNVNTAPPITLTVTVSIPDQGRVEIVTVTHMKASLIYLYIYGFYAFMCVWSFRPSEYEKMIWVIMMTVGGIISVAYTCVLLRRIRSSNGSSLYKGSETTFKKICSFRLYGIVSTGTWIENVT